MNWLVKSFIILLSFISMCYHVIMHAQPLQRQQISLSFSSVYPQSALKNLVSMAMRLWAEVNELQQENSTNSGLKSAERFAQHVLLLNTALDTTLIDAARSMHEHPESIENILHDMQQLLNVIKDLTSGYAQVLKTHTEKQIAPAASLFILEQIIKRMTKIITEGTVPANVYFARSSFHRKYTSISANQNLTTSANTMNPIKTSMFSGHRKS